MIYNDKHIEMFHGSEYRGRILQVCEERDGPLPPPPQPEVREHKERGKLKYIEMEG